MSVRGRLGIVILLVFIGADALRHAVRRHVDVGWEQLDTRIGGEQPVRSLAFGYDL